MHVEFSGTRCNIGLCVHNIIWLCGSSVGTRDIWLCESNGRRLGDVWRRPRVGLDVGRNLNNGDVGGTKCDESIRSVWIKITLQVWRPCEVKLDRLIFAAVSYVLTKLSARGHTTLRIAVGITKWHVHGAQEENNCV